MPPNEHALMLNCKHTPSDRLIPGVCCCGHLSLPDPSVLVLVAGTFYLAFQVVRVVWP